MTMEEFYNTYNLNRNYFASIAGVGDKSLSKYADGKKIREDTRLRIEKAMRIAEKYRLERPRYDYGRAFDLDYRCEFYQKNREYEDTFKRLIKEGS